MRSQLCRFPGFAEFLVLSSLFLFRAPSQAQDATPNPSGVSNCTVADLDTNIEFENEPDDFFGIVVHSRNITNHSCTFDGQTNGPNFIPDRVDGHEPFTLCYDCGNRVAHQGPAPQSLVLDAGAVVSQTFRWKTKQSSESAPCLQPKWMDNPILLVAPSLLKKVCSNIEVGQLTSDPPGKPAVEVSNDRNSDVLTLTSTKSAYYAGQMFALRVSHPDDSQTLASNASCPTLYLRQRSPDGATRIDEMKPLAFKGCPQPVLGHKPGDWSSGFDIDSGANSRWMGVGEHDMKVFQLGGSLDEPHPRFIYSNLLRIQIADPAAISRKWGTRVKGIAADITLDKTTFRLGEDVPLHLAIEDFDSPLPLYSWDPVWDPCVTVSIQVLGPKGRPLAPVERYSDISVCLGHGFGPRPFPKGTIIPIERTLATEGWLPNRAGTYKIVVSWAVCSGSKDQAYVEDLARKLKPYAVARAEATIQIVDGNDSAFN
jgi:hypothetical protein